MSRHEGVSCDSCMKGNFRGRRYKCLICYDYDLCASCYETGATTTRHTTEHPMQCILTRTDFEMYYSGESLGSDQPQAFTRPFCGKMGFTETSLQEHVTSDHADSSTEVVCPVCAAHPGGEPNHVTDDFAAHLTLEHRAPRDFEDPVGNIRHVRRIQHPVRGVGSNRPRSNRSNVHFQQTGSTISSMSPSNRETMDPIAELLSQLSSVRSQAAAAQSMSSQLQQLEMQLQNTSLYHHLSRHRLERLPRRTEPSKSTGSGASTTTTAAAMPSSTMVMDYVGALGISTGQGGAAATSHPQNSQFLLSRCGESDLTEFERQSVEVDRADRSVFVQEVLLSSLAAGLRLDGTEPCDDIVPRTAHSDSHVTVQPPVMGQSSFELFTSHVTSPQRQSSPVYQSINATPSSPRQHPVNANINNPRPNSPHEKMLSHRGGAANLVKRLDCNNKASEKEPPPSAFTRP